MKTSRNSVVPAPPSRAPSSGPSASISAVLDNIIELAEAVESQSNMVCERLLGSTDEPNVPVGSRNLEELLAHLQSVLQHANNRFSFALERYGS